jgi:hypothetical protein
MKREFGDAFISFEIILRVRVLLSTSKTQPLFVNLLEPKIQLNKIEKFSSYLTENSVSLTMQLAGKIVVYCDHYITRKYTVREECWDVKAVGT